LLRELAATLAHRKLQRAVELTAFTVEQLTQAYARQTFVVPDAALPLLELPPDPNDAVVIGTAMAAAAEWLVSGDHHLLDSRDDVPCEVLTVREALGRAEDAGNQNGPGPPGREPPTYHICLWAHFGPASAALSLPGVSD